MNNEHNYLSLYIVGRELLQNRDIISFLGIIHSPFTCHCIDIGLFRQKYKKY